MRFPDVAIGSIVAALIAATVSLLGLIISKELKVSEFRQSWVDSLRAELSKLIAHANAIHGASVAGSKTLATAWKESRADFLGINEAAANIRMRLNPDEDPSKKVLESIEELEKLLKPGAVAAYTEINKVEKDLVDRANTVLKAEWVVVKRGERVYRYTRNLAIAATIISAVFLLHAALFSAQIKPNQSHKAPDTVRVKPAGS